MAAVGATLAAGLTVPRVTNAESPGGDLPTPDDLSAAEIAEVLEDDAFVVDDGEILVTEPAIFGPQDGAPAEKPEPDGTAPMASASAAGAFSLHSRPTASRKIFLDFDGHTTTGTAWNTNDRPVIVSGIYSREAAGSQNADFSQTELDGIVDIWTRVAEDYAAWDVDITTEDPGVAGLTKSSSSDTSYGIRVVVSQTSAWYGPYGGAAYLFSLGRDPELPAFVFSSNLANGNPKSVAEAIAHEVGHTLGLRHDGINNSDGTVSGYYAGHGNWAPIMGVGYSRTVTQWSRGEYAGANNTEDDLAIIDQSLPRSFEWSSTTTLGASDSSTTFAIVAGGATNTHTVVIAQSPATIGVRKATADGNLLADVTIRDQSGSVVTNVVASTATNWSLTTQLAAGAYAVEVRSVGWQTPSSGFSSYASIGEYVLDLDVPGTSGTTTTSPSGSTTSTTTTTPDSPPPGTGQGGDRLTAISPRRLLDTREPTSPLARLSAGREVRFAVPGLPAGTSAVVVNVTAVNPADTGWLGLTPCNPVALADRTSSLNYVAGRNVANSIIAPVSADGALCLYSSADADVVLDITGWTEPNGVSALSDIGSQRLVDSRIGLGISRRLGPDERTVISLQGLATPDQIDAVAINVTAVNPAQSGFITVNDCSLSAPTSSLNFAAGETRGNNGIFTVSASTALCLTSSAATDVTVDVTGQFVSGEGLTFVATQPTRVLDTRSTGRLAAGASTGYTIPTSSGENGLTTVPIAASVNLASIQHTARGHVTSWDCSARPETSALNPVVGAPTANGALVEITATGRSCLYHSSGGDLVVDLAGWWV